MWWTLLCIIFSESRYDCCVGCTVIVSGHSELYYTQCLQTKTVLSLKLPLLSVKSRNHRGYFRQLGTTPHVFFPSHENALNVLDILSSVVNRSFHFFLAQDAAVCLFSRVTENV